ncbi:hypothetical protein E2562_001123 [Oryza meyeriana var. granulata]|uniref:Uncharacterized protein n=1 Tax=Oryza meyeriana var. granulata TaxID=110450 RepID=A0A6G1EDI1_9ORYZ|nr:hypothetical protein E2562_001123 [Oryza meyeriana var. granulata]
MAQAAPLRIPSELAAGDRVGTRELGVGSTWDSLATAATSPPALSCHLASSVLVDRRQTPPHRTAASSQALGHAATAGFALAWIQAYGITH